MEKRDGITSDDEQRACAMLHFAANHGVTREKVR